MLIGQHSSSKELLIAIQEAVECLQGNIQSESDFTDQPSPAMQLAVLVKLYSLSEQLHTLQSSINQVCSPSAAEAA